MRLLPLTTSLVSVCVLATFAQADEKATALFKEVETATRATTTLSADLVLVNKKTRYEGTVSLQRDRKSTRLNSSHRL